MQVGSLTRSEEFSCPPERLRPWRSPHAWVGPLVRSTRSHRGRSTPLPPPSAPVRPGSPTWCRRCRPPSSQSTSLSDGLSTTCVRKGCPSASATTVKPAPSGRRRRSRSRALASSSAPTAYILTNNHVAGDASEITVRLADGRSLRGKLVGRHKNTDLAVVKVEGHGFPFVSFEDKARPRVGDWVVAIGNPLNLGGTVTAGIVAAYGRNIGQQFVNYMQIDAPINRGNSGGPTFDVDGRVVGVNTAIFSPSGGSIGIGFAIPAILAQSVARQLISAGHVTRGYLGATIEDVPNDIALSLGRAGLKGAVVAEVTPGGPADRGRIEAGDIITGVDGEAVAGASSLTQEMAAARVGQQLRLEGLRSGQPFTATIRSGQRPSEEQLASTSAASPDEENGAGD